MVAWFGSHGVHAYDIDGNFLWKVDLGRVNMGAYDIPTFEWGPASSPIIWDGLVILQCDTSPSGGADRRVTFEDPPAAGIA